jgi:hypothetical protein
MRNMKIAAAVAMAIGGVPAAYAVAPTLANCQNPTDSLFLAGSSAAQKGFFSAVNTDGLGGNGVTYTSSNGNFQALCGISSNASLAPIGNAVVIHYRAEGGSVVGALPIVSGKAIKFLDISTATTLGGALTTTGTSATVGTTDGWGGALTTHTVEVGITDVEPAQFAGSNYPSAYSSAVFGTASPAQLAGLTKTALVDQVFGLFVNTSGINGGGTGQAIDLSRETAAAILKGTYTDWSQVPTASGGQVSSVAKAITVVNREAGSGSRAGASIYFLHTNCAPTGSTINDPNPAGDGYATGDVLATAGTTTGAITYASIDNAGKANLTTVSLNGVAPSNLAATAGTYDWWYEAQLIKGTITSTGGAAIYSFLTTELAAVSTAAHFASILAIPGVAGNVKHVPVVASPPPAGTTGTTTIYVNPFTRSNNSCNVPTG